MSRVVHQYCLLLEVTIYNTYKWMTWPDSEIRGGKHRHISGEKFHRGPVG